MDNANEGRAQKVSYIFRANPDPVIDYLLKLGLPVTRASYIDAAGLSEPLEGEHEGLLAQLGLGRDSHRPPDSGPDPMQPAIDGIEAALEEMARSTSIRRLAPMAGAEAQPTATLRAVVVETSKNPSATPGLVAKQLRLLQVLASRSGWPPRPATSRPDKSPEDRPEPEIGDTVSAADRDDENRKLPLCGNARIRTGFANLTPEERAYWETIF